MFLSRPKTLWTLLVILMVALPALAQRQKVPEDSTHFRILAVDKVVTLNGVRQPAHAAGMKAFVAIYNRDSSLCLVEYVADKHSDYNNLRQSADPQIVWFEKAQTKPEVFLNAARAAGFTKVDLDHFYVKVK